MLYIMFDYFLYSLNRQIILSDNLYLYLDTHKISNIKVIHHSIITDLFCNFFKYLFFFSKIPDISIFYILLNSLEIILLKLLIMTIQDSCFFYLMVNILYDFNFLFLDDLYKFYVLPYTYIELSIILTYYDYMYIEFFYSVPSSLNNIVNYWVYYFNYKFHNITYFFNFNFNYAFLYSIKLSASLLFLIFIRAGLPRYRYDYLTKLGWSKFLFLILFFFIFLFFIYSFL